MKDIYKITFIGIIITAAIAFLAARAFSEEIGTKAQPVEIGTEVSVIDGFYAESIKDATIEDEAGSYSGEEWLRTDGTVRHPEWFEGDKLILADGSYYLIKAKAAPEYYSSGSTEFSDMTDIGNAESEEKNRLEYVNASEPRMRTVGENVYTYRTLAKNGAMALNLKCAPDGINYLAVRLWGGDTGDTMLWICDPVSGNMNAENDKQPHRNMNLPDRRDWVELNTVSSSPQYDGGFIYVTYKIPEIYTRGKESVSLRLYSTGGPSDYGSVPIKNQTEESRGIYDVYMTQKPAFDPADYGRIDGSYDGRTDNMFSLSDAASMEAQRNALGDAVRSGIEALRKWQIYGEDAPEYMQGMITRCDWRSISCESEEDWKNSYYNSARMLRQNLTPLNMLELAAYAYNNSETLGLTDTEKAEMLDRSIKGIDFLCRAQGSNGGFFSDGWIGGPERKPASGNNLTGFGLRSAGECILEILGSLDDTALNEEIDSDADGIADMKRSAAWIAMLEKARDYLIDPNGGYGHAPNQDMANSIAALRFDVALGRLGGSTLLKGSRAAIFERCFGLSKNLATSCYWVSPKCTILENFGSIQGGYSGDYGSNAVVELSQLAQIGRDNYGYSYSKYMNNIYDTIDKYYFTGKKAGNGDFTAQEYTEGIISNRNVYYPGTERYPIDIYSALTLKNDTALKIISNYITQKDISLLISNTNELTPYNSHFEDNILDAAYLYLNFDEIIRAAEERGIEDYNFIMENDAVEGFAWADEMARNVVIKDGENKIYMALNWRSPIYSSTVYDAGKQSVKANNLCRVHAFNERYDSYGYAAMTTKVYSADNAALTDGYTDWTLAAESDGCMEALMSVKYGAYTVIMNSYGCGAGGNAKSFSSELLEAAAGLDRGTVYKDMISGELYSYGNGFWHSAGNVMKADAASTLVLKAMDVYASEPVITGEGASAVVTNNTDTAADAVLYAVRYEADGRLLEVKSESANAEPGVTELRINGINADKAFIWDKTQKNINK